MFFKLRRFRRLQTLSIAVTVNLCKRHQQDGGNILFLGQLLLSAVYSGVEGVCFGLLHI